MLRSTKNKMHYNPTLMLDTKHMFDPKYAKQTPLTLTTRNKTAIYIFYNLNLKHRRFLYLYSIFRSLGCPRVTIHKNLFISFILSCISNITWHITIIASAESKQEVSFIILEFYAIFNVQDPRKCDTTSLNPLDFRWTITT